jgi:hypothetical protein
MWAGLENLVRKAKPVAVASLPEPVVEPVVVAPVQIDLSDDDHRPVDELEEQQTNLPMRTPGRIRFLLETFEAGRPDRTASRIRNDQQRYALARKGEKSLMYNRTHPASLFGQ